MDLVFGAWLKKRRRLLDLTQEDLANRASCSIHTIRKIETGDLKPAKALALAIARAFELPPESHPAFVQFARTTDAVAAQDAFDSSPAEIKSVVGDGTPFAGALADAELIPDTPREIFHPPAPLAAVVGRERDTGVVTGLLRLPAARLVTLTGPPGTGKTRLSLEVAAELLADPTDSPFANGAAFVDLAPVPDPLLVETAIAEALNMRETANMTLSAALRAFLRDKQLLLVLDNFEHLLDAAPLVNELLAQAPGLKILVTSREPLHVYGERQVPVVPLGVPPLHPLPDVNKLERYPAVQLFVDRAQAVNPTFALTAQNANAVARLCVELDGLPLAIELAAARVRHDSPGTLLGQWNRRLDVLRSTARDREARQQTLRSALDWSYDLLDPDAGRVLRHLGVFRGGFSREAADAVCGEPVGPVLETLIEKSLVKAELGAAGISRLVLLETIREYAYEKLEAAGEAEQAGERHWNYFTALAESLETQEMRGANTRSVEQLNREHDNARRALDWAIRTGRAAHALTLTAALTKYWYYRHQAAEALQKIPQVLALNAEVTADRVPARARVRSVYADFLRMSGDYSRARPLLQETIADWRTVGESGKPHLAFALVVLSRLILWQGDATGAEASAREALDLFIALRDPHGQASAWRRLGEWALSQSRYEYAYECLDHALELQRGTDNLFGYAVSLLERGDIARATGDYARAGRDYEASAQVNETAQDPFVRLRLAHRRGILKGLRGDAAAGEKLLQEAVRLTLAQGASPPLPLLFGALAYCSAVQGQAEQAMLWLGRMDRALETMHMVLIGPDLLEYRQTLERVSQLAAESETARWRARGYAPLMHESIALFRKG